MMSCSYRALPKLIPQLLLLARPGSEIALVSPWVENVSLHPPPFRLNYGDRYSLPEIRLGNFLLRLARDSGMRVTFVVREHDARLEAAIRPLLRNAPDSLVIREVPHLHAKLIVTEHYVLETSANLLWTSLFRNVEWCRIANNPHGHSRGLLQAKLGIRP